MKILKNCEMIVVLHRIHADRDIPYHGVKVGDIGGWVTYKMMHGLPVWCCGKALIEGMVFDNAFVQNNARVDRSTITPILVVMLTIPSCVVMQELVIHGLRRSIR